MGRSSRSAGEFSLLSDLGLKTTPILGDGNCLFRALADQTFGDENRHKEIRERVVQFMRNNAKEFIAFIPVEVGGGHRRNPRRKNVGATNLDDAPISQESIDANFERYLCRMGLDRTWGDNLEIRAFSQAYDRNVKVYSRTNIFLSLCKEDGINRLTAHIALHSFEHYSSVRNIDGPHRGLPNIVDNETVGVPSAVPSTTPSNVASTVPSSVPSPISSPVPSPALSTRETSFASSVSAVPVKKAVTKKAAVAEVVPQDLPKRRRRLVTRQEYKAWKKLQKKKLNKERKKAKKLESSAARTCGMKTVTI